MDSTWIASWLAYVHSDKNFAPAPGPCSNRRLITYDFTEKKYVGRTGLIMARNDFGGDYRRVSKEVWEKFKEYYPESGPAITMVFELKDKNEKGFYDTSKWHILDVVEPPEDAGKKKKKKLLNLAVPLSLHGSKKDKDTGKTNQDESKPVKDPETRDSSTRLLSKEVESVPDKPSTLGVMVNNSNPVSNKNNTNNNDKIIQDYQADSDDDLDMVPQNSFGGKSKGSVTYSKVSEEKKDQSSGKDAKGKKNLQRDSVSRSALLKQYLTLFLFFSLSRYVI
jgi:hypothetical protein